MLAALRPGDIVVAARMDRCFRSAFDALQTIQDFKRRRIALWLLDLGDVSGNGISELTVTILAAVAQFERSLISERIKDAKRNLRRAGRHQGGSVPFGYRRGDANHLIAEPSEQAAISTIRQMHEAGASLMTIRDAVRAKGLAISHETVRRVLVRAAGPAAVRAPAIRSAGPAAPAPAGLVALPAPHKSIEERLVALRLAKQCVGFRLVCLAAGLLIRAWRQHLVFIPPRTDRIGRSRRIRCKSRRILPFFRRRLLQPFEIRLEALPGIAPADHGWSARARAHQRAVGIGLWRFAGRLRHQRCEPGRKLRHASYASPGTVESGDVGRNRVSP